MAWTTTGGQAILTLRSLIQSDRWQSAWELLRADFCKVVKVRKERDQLPVIASPRPIAMFRPVGLFNPSNYARLPLAA
jgi:hypothetical protein